MLQVTDDNFMLTLNAKEAEWVTFAEKGGWRYHLILTFK